MFTSMGLVLLAVIFGWGGYLYYRVSKLDRKISERTSIPAEGDNDH